MRRNMNVDILSVCLLLAAMPFMLGAVVLVDPRVESETETLTDLILQGDDMPTAHGPVLDLPSGPVVLKENPAVLAGPPDEGKTEDNASEKANLAAEDKTTDSKNEKETEEAGASEEDAPAAAPLEPLSPEMEALRDRLRRAIDYYSRQPLNTNDNTAANILKACLAFGCDTVVRQGGPSGEEINGITCLCWDYPCGGYNLLKMVDGHIAARVGYGLQSNPAEFLAVLALSRVPREYPLRVGKTVRTVADLVEAEKFACRGGDDHSLRLIGLARYLPAAAVWKNSLGEEWSIERMLKEELDHAQQPAPQGGTRRLMAVSYAVNRRAGQGLPIDGQYRRAKKYIDKYQDFALALQNADGSWHPEFFKYRGEGGSTIDKLNSSGHIMAWLASSLPAEKLDDPEVVRGMAFLADTLTGRRLGNLTSTSAADVTARMNAIYALNVYNRRVFRPYDKAAEQAAAAEEKEKSGKKTASAGAPNRR